MSLTETVGGFHSGVISIDTPFRHELLSFDIAFVLFTIIEICDCLRDGD